MKTLSVLKVGGSILSTSEEEIFSFKNVENLKACLVNTQDDSQFILTVGGGYLARKYQRLLRERQISEWEQHLVGVASINTNAVMLKAVFGDLAETEILRYEDFDSNAKIMLSKKFKITAAGHPGHSSDWNAVKLAIRAGAKQVVSLKNVDGVYTSDPRKNPNAKKLDKITWLEYQNIIGFKETFEPGGNYPVDPFATKLAIENNIDFVILDGRDLENLTKALNNESYIGTRISLS